MPKVLIVSAGRTGDLQQMERVAKALGWPMAICRLKFAKASNAAIALAPARYLTQGGVVEILAEDADVVLCAEASAAALAARAKAQGGTFKLVCIGRPRGRFNVFDLIITSPQYRLKPAPNVVELPAPPHDVPDLGQDDLALAAAIEGEKRPLLAVFVGGSSAPDVFDAAAAQVLAQAANTQSSSYSVHVVTSPRTGVEAVQALRAALRPELKLHVWPPQTGSPYRVLLHQADAFLVTSDSVSMVAEAMMTGKPVMLHKLPQKRSMWHQFVAWLSGVSIAKPFFHSGLLEPRPDRGKLFDLWGKTFGLVTGVARSARPEPLPQTAKDAAVLIQNLMKVNNR
jgi:uncharacterized protein